MTPDENEVEFYETQEEAISAATTALEPGVSIYVAFIERQS